jgi:hypothetical protein
MRLGRAHRADDLQPGLRLSERASLIVRAALIMVRDHTPTMPDEDMDVLKRVIDLMQTEGVEIVLRRDELD